MNYVLAITVFPCLLIIWEKNKIKEINIKDMDWSPCPKKKNNTVSGDYVVGQAYNKGNYQVLSKRDAADESTGKRR